MKRCPRCRRGLPEERFYKSRSSKDGLQSHCKECQVARGKTPQSKARTATRAKTPAGKEGQARRAAKYRARPLIATREIWKLEAERCCNPECAQYEADYGGRGITMHPDFLPEKYGGRPGGFERFLAHVGVRPSPHLELHRIDNDGGYTYGNLAWVTKSENGRNRRSTRWITFRGLRLSAVEMAERYSVPYLVFWHRVSTGGWSIERALTTPVLSFAQASVFANATRWKESLAKDARERGLNRHTVQSRVSHGMPRAEALSKPIMDRDECFALGHAALAEKRAAKKAA